MARHIIWGLLLLCIAANGNAQTFTKTQTGIKTSMQGMEVELSFYSPRIVRVLRHPEGEALKKQSLSVIRQPGNTSVSTVRSADIVTMKSASLQVELNLVTGKVAFKKPSGELLLTEKDHGTQFTRVKDVDKETYNVRQAFLLDTGEAIYGLGQLQNGKMSQRGQKVYLRQENMKVAIPFFQSAKGYGLFWDNYSPTTFTDNPQETSFDSEIGDCADYYFMWGGNADAVVAEMRSLTGQAPMMPLWSFGFSQSRERYKTQFELVDVVKTYRKLRVPLDGVIQDWQYWGRDSNWNAMSFDPSTYPRPQQMVDSVHKMKAHLFIVSWPGFGPQTKQYDELKQKNMLLNFDTWPPKSGARPYDVYNPQARDIYWNYLNKGLFSLGIDAWWLDSTEPDHINMKESDFDQPTYLGSFRSVRNAFPIEHVRGVYEHQRKVSSEKRVILLTRSAFAGQQRYGSNTWSGDVGSSWASLQRQIPAAINFSLTGLPYWNADIGGFFAGGFRQGGGAKNPEFQQLYVRWMQFSVFTPMMRSHGTDIPREIYQFGERGEAPFDLQEKFINMRYHLLPYSYASAWEVTHRSGSFIRPLHADFSNDKKVFGIGNEYLYGKSILVTPVTEKDLKVQNVYLPAGTEWYDFWTGEKHHGGQTLKKDVTMDIIPLYVKAGSVLPWGPGVQYATEKKWDDLEIRVYPGKDGEFTLYEDENDNYNYEKGEYSTIDFRWNDSSRTLTIEKRKGRFAGMLTKRKFRIVLAGKQKGAGNELSKQADKIITYNGGQAAIKL